VLFNSYEFIFGFLPVAALCFYVIGRCSRAWALRWLVAASLFFYAWWRPINVLIIAPSILINFAIARALSKTRLREDRRAASTALLVLGIAFNVAFLGYFKYVNFFADVANDVFGAHLAFAKVVLPLGISFITFQKIAFLIDVHAGRVKSFSLQDYGLFVLFFPQLIAGPIVHYREVMPQFHAASCRFSSTDAAVGVTLFLLGLAKKVLVADFLAGPVSVVYANAATGHGVTLLNAWIAAVGFTLQIYFDFSGYSDMALGLARLFGIRLPANFNSPLRAPSIIDFWLRWHITLTRFLTAYIYNPLVLTLSRRRAARGQPGYGGRNTTPGAFVQLLMMPTLVTMFISGLWHGAGYGFVLWGLLHGVYLAINHAWRLLVPRLFRDRDRYRKVMTPAGILITFLAVAAAMVLFRSPSLSAAWTVLKGMMGLSGVGLPEAVYAHLGPLAPWLQRLGVASEATGGTTFLEMAAALPILLAAVMLLPNTLELLSSYEPALGVKPRLDGVPGRKPWRWSPTVPWAAAVSAVAALAISSVAGPSEFLYWNF